MNNKVIAISRQFGSGGRTIGRLVAEKLGIPCYDQELIEKISEESGLCEDFIKERGEYASSGNWLANAFADRDYYGHSVQDDVWFAQRKVILELAEKGPCVIVGRCADYILRDVEYTLNVFLTSPMEVRVARIAEDKGISDEEAERMIVAADRKRAEYYNYYTFGDWGVASTYDLCLDSSMLGLDGTVDFIIKFADKAGLL